MQIEAGSCSYATIVAYAPPLQPNRPSQYYSAVWIVNTDGQDALDSTKLSGQHSIPIDVTVITRQVGPLLADGTARYQYVACMLGK
jgi:iron transport multicopper oxidase